jgi:hypothetical protein
MNSEFIYQVVDSSDLATGSVWYLCLFSSGD